VEVTNRLAYKSTELITAVKSFVLQTLGVNVKNFFFGNKRFEDISLSVCTWQAFKAKANDYE
jgi:hypothetical protein